MKAFLFVGFSLVVCAASGCRTHDASQAPSASANPAASTPAPSVEAAPHPKLVRAPPAASVELANAPGPAPSGSAVAREVRETAVLALLGDATFTRRMPVVALEPGREFDWSLRDRVAPRIVVPVPRIRLAETTARGALSKEIVQRVVRQGFARYRSCAANSRAETPTGRVTLDLAIDRDGRITSVTIARTTLTEGGVVRCLRDATQGLEFPAAAEATQATQVVELLPVGG